MATHMRTKYFTNTRVSTNTQNHTLRTQAFNTEQLKRASKNRRIFRRVEYFVIPVKQPVWSRQTADRPPNGIFVKLIDFNHAGQINSRHLINITTDRIQASIKLSR